MIKFLSNLLMNKKVLIFGFGIEGKSTFNILSQIENIDITIADEKYIEKINGYKTISLFNQDKLNDYDYVFKSPGIVLKNNDFKCKITSQSEIFIKLYREQIIAITATKGKSTTSSLIYHILKKAGKKVLLAGNIGIAMFDLVKDIDKDTIIVLELSCHQMQYIDVSSKYAILLNLFEEHLDHYASVNDYFESKRNIYKFQEKNDVLIINKDLYRKDIISNYEFIDDNILEIDSIENYSSLKGKHNLFNVCASYQMLKHFNIDKDTFLQHLKTFSPLKHRLEFIGNFEGIDYYDDSISTISQSCISSIKAIKNVETVLIGGMDRGIDYSELIEFINNNKIGNIILMYQSGDRIYKKLNNINNIKLVDNLYEAVMLAKKITSKNKACVLSPASASYGYFKNFEQRGDVFKKLVEINKPRKVLLVSDSHLDTSTIKNLINKHKDVTDYIHCGDSEDFKENLYPFITVKGNNDYYIDDIDYVLELDFNNVFVTHGHKYLTYLSKNSYINMINKAKKLQCNTIFFGHLHKFIDETIDGIRIINPSSTRYNRDGTKPSYLIVEEQGLQLKVKRYEI